MMKSILDLQNILKPSMEEAIQVLSKFTKVLEAWFDINIENTEIIVPYCKEANLWIPRSAPIGLVSALKDLVDRNEASTENVKKIFLNFYEIGNRKNLREMVDAWKENPYFSERMEIIYDAFEAHKEGKFTLSIPTLLPHVEGISKQILPGISGVKNTVEETISSYDKGYFMVDSEREMFLELIINPYFFGSFNNVNSPEEYKLLMEEKELDIENSVNRHAILHGFHLDYATKINSLRVFFVLDALFWMKREEWDDKFRAVLEM